METPTIAKQEPIPMPLKTATIPDLAVKLILGAKAQKSDGVIFMTFEGTETTLHEEDWELAKKVAERVILALPSKITPGVVISAMKMAQKATAEEIFSQGALRMLYYPVVTEASAFYRCIIPAMAVTSAGKIVAHVSRTKIAREALDYKVIVFQLDYSPATLRLAQQLRKMGKKVVFEVDDAFDALEEWHPGYAHYKDSGVQEQIKSIMAEVDLVTVTTEYLKDRYSALARRVAIVPNCITLSDWPKAEANTDGTHRVLWAGSPSHFGDLQIVGKALSTFAKAYPQVRLVFFGRKPVGLDCDEKQIEFHEWAEFKDFPVKLADLKADVAIAPLADSKFNYAKSNLRLIQYAATGYPIIASEVGEYKKSNTYVEGARDEAEWLSALELSLTPEWKSKMKLKSAELAKLYDITQRTPEIEKVYLGLAKE